MGHPLTYPCFCSPLAPTPCNLRKNLKDTHLDSRRGGQLPHTASTPRVVESLAVGAMASGLVLALIGYLLDPVEFHWEFLGFISWLGFALFLLIFPPALIVGVPAYYYLQTRGWFYGWGVVGLGALVGGIWGLGLSAWFLSLTPDLLVFSVLGGVLTAAIFWLTVHR